MDPMHTNERIQLHDQAFSSQSWHRLRIAWTCDTTTSHKCPKFVFNKSLSPSSHHLHTWAMHELRQNNMDNICSTVEQYVITYKPRIWAKTTLHVRFTYLRTDQRVEKREAKYYNNFVCRELSEWFPPSLAQRVFKNSLHLGTTGWCMVKFDFLKNNHKVNLWEKLQ